MIRQQIRYEGRVQGVGFRATARHIAHGFEVSGWVRNEADGAVLLEAQAASADELGRFVQALRARMGGMIHREQPVEISPAPGEQGFEIRF